MAALGSGSSPSLRAVRPGTNADESGIGILSEMVPGASIGRKLRRFALLGSGEGGARRFGEDKPGDTFSMSREG